MRDELERRFIGPMQIVERHDDRAPACDALQQRPHRAMRQVALVLQRRRALEPRSANGRQHAGELHHLISDKLPYALVADRSDVVVQRVDPDAK